MIRHLSYVTTNSAKPLYLILNKINGYIEESNGNIQESIGNKYLTLVPTDERKYSLTKYEKLWRKIRDFIRSIINDLHNSKLHNSDNCNGKCMKIKFNSDDNLLLKKTLELDNMIKVVRSVLLGRQQILPAVFLDECFYIICFACWVICKY